MTIHPWNGGQSPGFWGREHEVREVVLDGGDLLGEKVNLAQGRVDRFPIVGWELLTGKPLTSGDPERVSHRRLVLQVPVQHGEDFVLASRASNDEVRAALVETGRYLRGD